MAAVAGIGKTCVDPYRRWAERTDWRCYRRDQDGASGRAPTRVRILAAARSAAHLQAVFQCRGSLFEISDLYPAHGRVPGGAAKPALHFTATVPVDQLHRLDEPQFGLRWELAVPLREAQTEVQANPIGLFGEGKRPAQSMLAPEVLAPPAARPQSVGSNGAPPIGDAIAVIDYGAPFLHRNFTDDKGCTRIKALWDQDLRSKRSWWATPAKDRYGRELSAAMINKMLDGNRDKDGRQLHDEATVYRSLDYLIAYNDPRRRTYVNMHGAHVLDVAGGNEDPLDPLRPQPAMRKKGERHAGNASLVFVQLPAMTAADSSGSSLGAQLLDAVRYVLDVCGADARVVINISYGSAAGAHDGTSLIESALDELLERRRTNFAIVLAAGNSRNARCHTQRVVRKERSARLRIVVEPEDSTDTFVEVWYRGPDKPYQPELAVRARTPGHDWSDWVAPGEELPLLELGETRPAALLQHCLSPSGSLDKSMMLLSIAPTIAAVDDNGPVAEVGVWDLEIRLQAAVNGRDPTDEDAITLDAWVERDEPGDFGVGAQPHFADLNADDETNTLSSIATGEHTVVVGGYRLDGEAPVDYGSWPELGVQRDMPFVLAVCEEDAQHPGIRAAAVRSVETFRMNGTSVAAPVVARQLFNEMVGRKVDRTQWPGILERLAKTNHSFVRLPAPDDL